MAYLSGSNQKYFKILAHIIFALKNTVAYTSLIGGCMYETKPTKLQLDHAGGRSRGYGKPF